MEIPPTKRLRKKTLDEPLVGHVVILSSLTNHTGNFNEERAFVYTEEFGIFCQASAVDCRLLSSGTFDRDLVRKPLDRDDRNQKAKQVSDSESCNGSKLKRYCSHASHTHKALPLLETSDSVGQM